jgi:hypothetical protein
LKVERTSVSPDGTRRLQDISITESGDLVWACQDLGPGPGVLMAGSREYEFSRTIRAEHLPRLAAAVGVNVLELPAWLDREFKSDLELDALATASDIPTEFWSWNSTNWDD